jgi:Protein of unknown function (DUF3365)
MEMKSGLLFVAMILFGSTFSFYSCKRTSSGQQASSEEKGRQESVISDSIYIYLERGQKYVTATQSVLAKNLLEAINKDGAPYALEFCNERAYPLTDSLARVYHAGIRRVTDKARNTANKANAMEMAHMALLQSNLAKGESPAPLVTEQNGKMTGYYPILTNAMCLQCHGKPNMDISKTTLDKIHALYPDDQATGYGANELRGLWVVEMDKQ